MKFNHTAKTAVVDIDNTLWQFCDAFYRELKKVWNRAYGGNGFGLFQDLRDIEDYLLQRISS